MKVWEVVARSKRASGSMNIAGNVRAWAAREAPEIIVMDTENAGGSVIVYNEGEIKCIPPLINSYVLMLHRRGSSITLYFVR